jgi:hypothetical protein
MGDSPKAQLEENQASERTDGIPDLVASGTPPPGAPPGDGHHVTREQLAKVIGRDERTIRRWERTRLAPAFSVGPDGVHRFDVERVRELIEVRHHDALRPVDAFDGETAATVFALFAEGVDPADVVMRLKIHPTAVEAMHERFRALRGAFLVSRESAREISVLLGTPIADVAELVARLKEAAHCGARCGSCRKEFVGEREALCAGCARDLSVEAARKRETQAAAERAKREERRREQREEAAYETRIRELDREIAERRRRSRDGT